MKSIEEFFGKKPMIPSVNIPDAEKYIRQGLEYFCGKDYTWLPCYDEVVEWSSNNEQKGLFLLGDYGTGKTLISCRILLPLINYFWKKNNTENSGYWLRMFSASDLKDAYESNNSLIIDDLGIEDVGNRYGEKVDYFARVANKVEYNCRLLICTTNLNESELKNRYGVRVWDRMRALMKPVVFDNHGKSLRK